MHEWEPDPPRTWVCIKCGCKVMDSHKPTDDCTVTIYPDHRSDFSTNIISLTCEEFVAFQILDD